MDEISRELPIDSTTAPPVSEVTKGPAELVAYERSTVAENLVVRDRLSPSAPAESLVSGPAAGEPSSEGEASPPAAEVIPDADAPELPAPEVDAGAAAAAIAAEADTAEIEEDLGGDDDEGLPAVPELADAAAVAKMVFVLMLSSREGLSLFRLAQACNTTQKLVEEALALLQQQLQGLGLPVELARTGDAVKWMSTAETFPYLQRLRGVKKLEKLSPAALETLAVIAYRQPVMRSEIEAIRGVKAGPMLRTLLHHKLVKVTGRSEVPGRPLQYGTTPQFLERFGLASLQELPSIKEWKSLG
jgi:segregation and condensation protein B